jgi:drug/metabolite transporter (DMT)-like permease
MPYLLLSIVAAVAMALIVKWGESRRQDRMTMMAWNYLAATALSGGAVLLGEGGAPAGFTLWLGAVTGVTYAGSLLLWMMIVPQAGLGVSTAAMRLSVVWPALVSIAAFGEVPSAFQSAGVLLAFVAIALLSRAGGVGARPLGARTVAWLAALFVVSGGNGALMKVFTEQGASGQRPLFLATIFLSAGIICWSVLLLRRPRLRAGDTLRGALFGVVNLAGNGLLLKALSEIPGVVAFPLRDSGVILLVSLAGVLLFRERPGAWGLAALAVAALAVVSLSL